MSLPESWFQFPWNNQHNFQFSSSFMIFKLSSFLALALAFALSSLDTVIGLQITGRSNFVQVHADIKFEFYNGSAKYMWVFCYLPCNILKASLNVNINSIGVHVEYLSTLSISTLQMQVLLWVVFISKCGSRTEILSLLDSLRRYVTSRMTVICDLPYVVRIFVILKMSVLAERTIAASLS